MTSIFEARRAGQIPAITPAMPAAISTKTIPTTGMPRTRPSSLSASTAATAIKSPITAPISAPIMAVISDS